MQLLNNTLVIQLHSQLHTLMSETTVTVFYLMYMYMYVVIHRIMILMLSATLLHMQLCKCKEVNQQNACARQPGLQCLSDSSLMTNIALSFILCYIYHSTPTKTLSLPLASVTFMFIFLLVFALYPTIMVGNDQLHRLASEDWCLIYILIVSLLLLTVIDPYSLF